MTSPKNQIFTVGHSTRTVDEFLQLLAEFEVQALADVRRFPRSRKFPHFNREHLVSLLKAKDIEYVWFENLGGFRHAGGSKPSPNMALENPGFRNYADYMMTDDFHAAIRDLLSLASRRTTALMCAERLFWKCHRRILSDFLMSQGVLVTHILETSSARSHELTRGALIGKNGSVTYPLKDVAENMREEGSSLDV